MNQNFELPPSYIDENDIGTWLLDVFGTPFGLPCVCGDDTETLDLNVVRPYIIDICQFEDNPCFIEINFHLGTAQGIYHYQPNLSGYSLDTTNGQDGIWHQLQPAYEHDQHNPSINNSSLAGSDKVDATWAFAQYNPQNPAHGTLDPCVPNWHNLGIPTHKFVFDMCEHVDTWLNETDISFRLTFDKRRTEPVRPLSCGITTIDG